MKERDSIDGSAHLVSSAAIDWLRAVAQRSAFPETAKACLNAALESDVLTCRSAEAAAMRNLAPLHLYSFAQRSCLQKGGTHGITIEAEVVFKDKHRQLRARTSSPVDAFILGLRGQCGINVNLVVCHGRALASAAPAFTVAVVEVVCSGIPVFGIASGHDKIKASLDAIVDAINRALRLRRLSKFLSKLLRHEPEIIGIFLDVEGWVSVAELLAALARQGETLSLNELHHIIGSGEKLRYVMSVDGLRVRALQGHSVPIDLGYEPCEPPAVLYHGTARKFLPSIQNQGLLRGRRHHVHLSSNVEKARSVGARRGPSLVLTIDAAKMHADEYEFFLTPNGVWLTNRVPPGYITGS